MVIEVQQQLNNERIKDANAAITLLEKWPEKIQALNWIGTHDLCVTGAMLYQLSYQRHMWRRDAVSEFICASQYVCV